LFNLPKTKIDLEQLENITIRLAKISVLGNIYLLNGELGAGKTTFSRFLINSIFDNNIINRPDSIKSPSFPIMINYSLKNFEIFHYDLYRLNNQNELQELNIIENLKENITLVEWPHMIINELKKENYFFINLEILDLNERIIEIKYIQNKEYNNEL